MNKKYIVEKIAEEIRSKDIVELKNFIAENMSDIIEKEIAKTVIIYDDQDENGNGFYVHAENNNICIDFSADYDCVDGYAEISKEKFRVLFADEFAALKAENENLKKLLSIAKGD